MSQHSVAFYIFNRWVEQSTTKALRDNTYDSVKRGEGHMDDYWKITYTESRPDSNGPFLPAAGKIQGVSLGWAE